ncbi:alpha/beta hydrolase [Actinomadura gamaensis]|uniref:Alpha/beta hydrolase n=1 Tax=Actinomadura gamaensis TaxID=1763541 RepID=A0ABV9TXX3_9ACTN
MARPIRGTAAGLGYVALPPTAVDARASGPTRLVVAWPGFDPPRAAAAMAAAVPMTGVPTWRVYLDLPRSGDPAGGLPTGLDSQVFLSDAGITAFGTAVEQGADRLPAVLADLRRDLGVPAGPVALTGFSAGAAVVLLVLARREVQVSTAALIAPVVSPARAARSVEKRAGRERIWSPGAIAMAERLDLSEHAARIAGAGAALLLIGGARDRIVPAAEVTALRDLLSRCGAPTVESATFRMGHALAAEPGLEARAPITEAVRVDGVLTDWFRERLAEPASRSAPPVSLHLTGSSS